MERAWTAAGDRLKAWETLHRQVKHGVSGCYTNKAATGCSERTSERSVRVVEARAVAHFQTVLGVRPRSAMAESKSVVLKHQARVVAPHAAYHAGHQFIAGTTSLRDDNELVVVAFNDDRYAVAVVFSAVSEY